MYMIGAIRPLLKIRFQTKCLFLTFKDLWCVNKLSARVDAMQGLPNSLIS